MENPWVTALYVVKFDEKHGQQFQSIFPPSLPSEFMQDFKMLAMPDCMEPGEKHEFVFMVRIRDKRKSSRTGDFLNCFVAFRQCKDLSTSRGYFQQSVVLVSRLPFIGLFQNILARLCGVLGDIPELEALCVGYEQDSNDISHSKFLPRDRTIVDSSLEVAFQHFFQWPKPYCGAKLSLPFYGNMIVFHVPSVPFYLINPRQMHLKSRNYTHDDIFRKGGLNGGTGLFGSINLMATFGDLGLLPHLWTLWELVITGQDIVVWSPSAAICSSVVTALVSLCAPLGYGGDYRPYINPYDSDINTFIDAASKPTKTKSQATAPSNKETLDDDSSDGVVYTYSIAGGPLGPDNHATKTSFIVGITNPFLLKSFAHAQAAIFVPNPVSLCTKKSGAVNYDSESKVKAFRDSATSTSTSSSTYDSSAASVSYSLPLSVNRLPVLFSVNVSAHTPPPPPPPPPVAPLQKNKVQQQAHSTPKFSALGLSLSLSDGSLDKDDSSSSPRYKMTNLGPAQLKLIGADDSLEKAHDAWWTQVQRIRKHAAKSSISKLFGDAFRMSSEPAAPYCVMFIRAAPTVAPDADIQRLLLSLSSKSDQHEGDKHQHASHAVSAGLGANEEVIYSDSDEKTVIGNMLLREHFRSMTVGLINGVSCPLSLEASVVNPFEQSPCLRHASNLDHLTTVTLQDGAFPQASPTITYPTHSVNWQHVMKKFATSCHYQAWQHWAGDMTRAQRVLSLATLCAQLSTSQLLQCRHSASSSPSPSILSASILPSSHSSSTADTVLVWLAELLTSLTDCSINYEYLSIHVDKRRSASHSTQEDIGDTSVSSGTDVNDGRAEATEFAPLEQLIASLQHHINILKSQVED